MDSIPYQKYAGSTTPIEYTVEETVRPPGHTVGYSVVEGVLTGNKHAYSRNCGSSSRKVWVDGENQDGIRPDKCNRAVISKWHSS